MVLRLTPRSPRRRIRLVTVIGELTACEQPGWARNASADLTPATGARTTRLHRTPQHRSSACRRSLTSRKPALPPHFTRNAAASTASRPNVRDDGQRPSFGPGRRSLSPDLGLARSELFLREGLDEANHVETAQEIRAARLGGQSGLCPVVGVDRSSFRTEPRCANDSTRTSRDVRFRAAIGGPSIIKIHH
jgi:hypothetical protein